MGRVFLENPTLFLEMVALFFGQNGGLFWVKFESTPQMGVLSGVKMGELLAAPESYLLPLLPFYLWDFLYMISFYSLTSILEFTSETSERERKQRTCKYSFKHPHLLMLHMMLMRFLLSSTNSISVICVVFT